jgi:hypothetical protein
MWGLLVHVLELYIGSDRATGTNRMLAVSMCISLPIIGSAFTVGPVDVTASHSLSVSLTCDARCPIKLIVGTTALVTPARSGGGATAVG